MKTVFEEPEHLSADLGRIAKYRSSPVRAVGSVGLGGLTSVLFLQRLLVLNTLRPHHAVQQQRH